VISGVMAAMVGHPLFVPWVMSQCLSAPWVSGHCLSVLWVAGHKQSVPWEVCPHAAQAAAAQHDASATRAPVLISRL